MAHRQTSMFRKINCYNVNTLNPCQFTGWWSDGFMFCDKLKKKVAWKPALDGGHCIDLDWNNHSSVFPEDCPMRAKEIVKRGCDIKNIHHWPER